MVASAPASVKQPPVPIWELALDSNHANRGFTACFYAARWPLRFLGGTWEENPDIYQVVSPVTHVTADDP